MCRVSSSFIEIIMGSPVLVPCQHLPPLLSACMWHPWDSYWKEKWAKMIRLKFYGFIVAWVFFSYAHLGKRAMQRCWQKQLGRCTPGMCIFRTHNNCRGEWAWCLSSWRRYTAGQPELCIIFSNALWNRWSDTYLVFSRSRYFKGNDSCQGETMNHTWSRVQLCICCSSVVRHCWHGDNPAITRSDDNECPVPVPFVPFDCLTHWNPYRVPWGPYDHAENYWTFILGNMSF